MTGKVFSKPYIPPYIDKQLKPEQKVALINGEQIDGRKIMAKNGKFYNCDLKINPKTNGLSYVYDNQKETKQQEQAADQTQAQETPQKGQGRKR